MKTYTIERKELERLRFAMQTKLDGRLVRSMYNADCYYDHAIDNLVYQITCDIFGERDKTERVEWPATWRYDIEKLSSNQRNSLVFLTNDRKY